MGPSSGAHHAQHRAAGGGGGSGSSSSGQAPPPATQWAAFKRALASEQRFDYCYWISVGLSAAFDRTMRMLGPCLVVLAVLLIGSVAFLYYGYLLPLLVARPLKDGPQRACLRFLHGAWATFLLFNILFNYAACVLTPPGGLVEIEQEHEQLRQGQGQRSSTNEQEEARVDPSTYGFCKKCRIPRPPRAHHCHVCRRCVLKMDHHCPWINNCVGQNNYRPFVLFLAYLTTACAYGVQLLWQPFWALVYGGNSGPQMPVIVGSLASERSAVVFVFVLALSVGAALTGLLGWHVYLISTGQTTIEFYVNKARRERARLRGVLYSNPYDRGSCGRNWGQVFGDRPWWRALLPSTRSPPPAAVDWAVGEDEEGEEKEEGGGHIGRFVSGESGRLLLRVV